MLVKILLTVTALKKHVKTDVIYEAVGDAEILNKS